MNGGVRRNLREGVSIDGDRRGVILEAGGVGRNSQGRRHFQPIRQREESVGRRS
jgi:hypothetical protein